MFSINPFLRYKRQLDCLKYGRTEDKTKINKILWSKLLTETLIYIDINIHIHYEPKVGSWKNMVKSLHVHSY
jgi:hypothetical protein